MRIRYSRIYGGTDILSRVEGVTWGLGEGETRYCCVKCYDNRWNSPRKRNGNERGTDLSPRKYQGQWPVCTREREFPATEWSTDWFHRLSFYEFSRPLAPRFFDAYAYVTDVNVITENIYRSMDRSIYINETMEIFVESLSSGDANLQYLLNKSKVRVLWRIMN